jgi:hypothetical protein
MLYFTVIGTRAGKIVRLKRDDLLKAELTSELLESDGWAVTIRIGKVIL